MERGLALWNIYEKSESQVQSIVKFVVSLVIVYLGYKSYRHISNFGDIMAGTYSTGGKIINVILWPVAVIVVVIAAVIVIYLVRQIFKFLYIAIPETPGIIRHEVEIIKRIWNNRGFGKYSLFGGFVFYAKLRQRVFAYFFAFLSIGIVTWYFAFKQHEYEKMYWKINFYYNEPLPVFKFKPNIPYTIKAGPDFYGIIINGSRYVTGKNTYFTKDIPNKIPLTLPDYWNITFYDTTRVEFMFYEEPINQIFSMTLEVWEDEAEGKPIYPSEFTYEWQKK